MRLSLYSVFLFAFAQICSSSTPSSFPHYNDDFCERDCSSKSDCTNRFSDDYIDLSVRTNHSVLDGPGQSLSGGIFLGDTIARHTFFTQFVLDVSTALNVSPCRLYILNVSPEVADDEGSWNIQSCIIAFRLLPADTQKIRQLTSQVQDPFSKLLSGKVSSQIDPLYGLVATHWDFSLKLIFSIIGEDTVRNNTHYLNQGGERWCYRRDVDNSGTPYCRFETLFRQDLASALEIRTGGIDVLFVKPAGEDSVIVSFRIIPKLSGGSAPSVGQNKSWIDDRVEALGDQISNHESLLYQGDVTFALDPTWGVSNRYFKALRWNSKYVSRAVRPTSEAAAYERCKATHRCSRGWSYYNQSRAEKLSTMQRFAGGKHKVIPLFADFEDWREGTRGWKQNLRSTVSSLRTSLPGAHWSPFDFASLGPKVPSFNTTFNSGLVLNRASLDRQLEQQSLWMEHIREYIDWLKEKKESSSLDARTRSRSEIRAAMNSTITEYKAMLDHEESKYSNLSNSQCRGEHTNCTLVFNTSNLELTGVINATGTIAQTPDGIDVVIWSFDSIDLDENVYVTLTGQRSMALLSRSSIRIDAMLVASPGTLGGFPGGFSVSRKSRDRLMSVCSETKSIRRDFGHECSGDQSIATLQGKSQTISNNVNGIGSGSVRVYLKTIEMFAPHVDRVQTVTTDARAGQILSGGFKLNFNGYSSTLIPHHATAKHMKEAIEDSLNTAKDGSLCKIDNANAAQGIGRVSVTRASNGISGGFTWTIKYDTAIGNQGNLTATNLLKGGGASVVVETQIEGNYIQGNFSLSFLGNITRSMPHNVSAKEMERILKRDILDLDDASVIRSDPTNNCDAGLCDNGPSRSGGYLWTLTLVTQAGNISPSSPTSNEFDLEGAIVDLIAINNLTGCIEDDCPKLMVEDGHSASNVEAMRILGAKKPFSLAFGGAGASHGGKGGQGFSGNAPGQTYGNKDFSNLHGGSGGTLGFSRPFEILLLGGARARGGSGGGALGIIAANDISFGPKAIISCDGEDGYSSYTAGGGGGSGGSILVSAGGSIRHEGNMSANGGLGGQAMNSKKNNYGGGGGGGGRVSLHAESISFDLNSQLRTDGGPCQSNNSTRICDGGIGTISVNARLHHNLMYIDTRQGAAGTSSSLRLIGSTNPIKDQLPILHGPVMELGEMNRPGRISLFVSVGNHVGLSQSSSARWGAIIELRSSQTRPKYATNSSPSNDYSAIIGIHIAESMRHGANIPSVPHDYAHVSTMSTFSSEVEANRWYKIDIRLDWKEMRYDILLDDVLLVREVAFVTDDISAIGLSNYDSNIEIWFDEIYVGSDATMAFRCPYAAEAGMEPGKRPDHRGWIMSQVGGDSFRHKMVRHESHVSRRALYNRKTSHAVIAPYDGMGQNAFTSDVKFRPDKDSFGYDTSQTVAGSLLKLSVDMAMDGLPPSIDPSKSKVSGDPQAYVWYGEYENSHIHGGVAACSTKDFVTWKNEGIMLHYSNLTDMIRNRSNPLHVERPKVIYNNDTKLYIMWMTLENESQGLAMAGVASSKYATGPFDFVRSFYPDGNKTRDQTLVQKGDGSAYLIRSYYATVEYVLPSAVMQPTWESVKDANGNTDFALSYHRAVYEPEYDNYHDIYFQRWTTEDKPWKVVCVDRITATEREVPYGEDNLNHDGEVCKDPFEYKKVLGQGNPSQENTKGGIQSRFLDPHDPANNAWRPESIPGIKAQPWRANYRDGVCGVRQVEKEGGAFDPNLLERNMTARGECSNVADNPVHGTKGDKLIGSDRVVESRRAKFIDISPLTDDYLDTTGVLTTLEGELDAGADLISLVKQAESPHSFGWTASDKDQKQEPTRTYSPRVHSEHFHQSNDWQTRFHQYEEQYNDRARYSIACQIDGHCPVDFKSQITKGHV